MAGFQVDKEALKNNMKDHMEKKIMVVDEKDKQVWDLVTDVPLVTKPVAVISAVLNLLIPGLGTAIAACSAKDNVSKT